MLIVRDLYRSGLRPLSFELNKGECVALLGSSGSGKSLLLRAIADLDPNIGQISLDGQSREAFTGPSWRRRVMYLPAESGWWNERVVDHFSDWDAAIPLVTALLLPEEVRDRTVQRLSTGERQRLALARSLVLKPCVLLLDEPTSALDKQATLAVEQLVGKSLAGGASALWVTHDASQAQRVARRALVLNGGAIEQSTP
jgi:phosphate-transporting ATPase